MASKTLDFLTLEAYSDDKIVLVVLDQRGKYGYINSSKEATENKKLWDLYKDLWKLKSVAQDSDKFVKIRVSLNQRDTFDDFVIIGTEPMTSAVKQRHLGMVRVAEKTRYI